VVVGKGRVAPPGPASGDDRGGETSGTAAAEQPITLAQVGNRIVNMFESVGMHDHVPRPIAKRHRLPVHRGKIDELVSREAPQPKRNLPSTIDLKEND
jgi:hypothetical protein